MRFVTILSATRWMAASLWGAMVPWMWTASQDEGAWAWLYRLLIVAACAYGLHQFVWMDRDKERRRMKRNAELYDLRRYKESVGRAGGPRRLK